MMKITIHKSVLLKQLIQVSVGASDNNVVEVLRGVLFSLNEERLQLVAGDTNFFIKTEIPATDYKIHKPGAIILYAKEVTEVIKRMPDSLIDIEVKDTSAKISSGKTKITLRGIESEMFPKLPSEPQKHDLEMPGNDLKELIQMTSFAVSKKEDFPIITGIRMSFTDSGIKFTACDRKRFAIVTDPLKSDLNRELVIASEHMGKVNSAIKDSDTVFISVSDPMVIFKSADIAIYARILNGSYPDVESMFSNSEYAFSMCKRSDLVEALERSRITAEKNKNGGFLIKLQRINGEVVIESKNEYAEETRDHVTAELSGGKPILVGCDGKYLLDALKAIKDDTVKIRFAGEGMPVIISNGDEDLAMYLICIHRLREDLA